MNKCKYEYMLKNKKCHVIQMALDNNIDIEEIVKNGNDCPGYDECKFYEAEEKNYKQCDDCIEYDEKNGCEYASLCNDYNSYFKEKENDVIKPSHYKSGEFDVIDFCQRHDIPFDLGNVIKYVTRAGKKEGNSELQDLNKAMEFLKRRIEFVEGRK